MRYDYDMLGNPIRSASMEAGERWMLNDVAGKAALRLGQPRSPTAHRLRRAAAADRGLSAEGGEPELLVGRTVYGETQPNPEANNLRGKPYQAFDGAGVVTTDEYDFKGNLLRSSRQLAVEYKTTLDWSTPWRWKRKSSPPARASMRSTAR